MDPVPTLMGIPTELRLKIIRCVANSYRKRPQIFHGNWRGDMDDGWLDHEPRWQKPAGLKDVIALGKVNCRLRDEVKASFMSKVAAQFAMSPRRRDGTLTTYDVPDGFSGLQTRFSAYRALHDQNKQLHNAMRTLTRVNLELGLNDHTLDAQFSPLRSLMYFKLPVLDHYRFLVQAIYASPTIRRVNMCITCEVDTQYDTGGAFNLESHFEPFKRLKACVELDIHAHLVLREGGANLRDPLKTEVPLLSAGYLSQDDLDYLDSLQENHELDADWEQRPSLHDEWVRFRSCLIKSLPLLHEPVGEQYSNTIVNSHFSLFGCVDSTYVNELASGVSAVWEAHKDRDQEAFDKGRERVARIYEVQANQRARFMRQGISGLEGSEAESAKIDPDCEAGVFEVGVRWAGGPHFSSWTEYAKDKEDNVSL